MGAKRTKYLVYVDKPTMEDPGALFDAVMAHFIRKDLDPRLRKEFFAKFLKLSRIGGKEKQLAFIDEWVAVRDAATFPFRKRQEEKDADKGVEGRVSVDDGADEEEEYGAASDGSDSGDGSGDAEDGAEGD